MDFRTFIETGMKDLENQIWETERKLNQLIGGRFVLSQTLEALGDGAFELPLTTEANPEGTPDLQDILGKIAAGEDLLPENVTVFRKKRAKQNGNEETANADEGDAPQGDADEGGDGEVS